ncbi:MAG TPA: class I SAM-dependent methyltransferase [Mycobacteriales bacterium]|nr:class I SAM-dependent methyltransferase [Mycobacteriales bacterium]
MCAPDWLTLREGADASARAPELVERVRAHLQAGARPGAPAVIRDLGCGTGSMGRWLAGRLPGPQLWILRDRDPRLLARAGAGMPSVAADGAAVTARTHERDLTDLRAAELAGTSLVTASAVLDLLTSEEVDGLASACVEAGCAALLTLTVIGCVEISPSDPLDATFAAAFDSHQRRRAGGRRLLGPDAGPAAVDAFAQRGAAVESRPSPWRLGADQAGLAEEWLRGWIGAACAQQPDLERHAGAYLRRRLDACTAGELRVVVGHVDVLALPAGAS